MSRRALDHIVWPTRDLDGLAESFRRLGFTVGRRNRHPWGTVNHIVQFKGCFLELLGFEDDYRPVLPTEPAYPFAGFCADFLSRSVGGPAMLVLRSADAASDAKLFRRRGLGEGRLLPFSRAAQGPDGSDRTVAFTVAFADLPGLPDIGAFTCQQHRPENFWNPAAQVHANGVTGIGGIAVETPDIETASAALRRFAGQDPTGGADHAVPLSNSVIDVTASLRDDRAPDARSHIAGLQFDARDLSRLTRVLAEADMLDTADPGQVRVTAHGTDLVFRSARG